MSKQKTKKSLQKRVKISALGKIMRRHQFAAGHLKRNKSKGALEGHKKMSEMNKGEMKTLRKMLGI